MNQRVGSTLISLVQGDITKQRVDVIVNAANSSLLGGGGVDGAIHRAGGPAILEECRKIRATRGSLSPGEAVVTTAGNLPARRVIHTVGPVWNGGEGGERDILSRCYMNSLALAQSENLHTIAFPSISTGAYRFPIEEAATIAFSTVSRFAHQYAAAFDEIRLVLFTADDLATYSRLVAD